MKEFTIVIDEISFTSNKDGFLNLNEIHKAFKLPKTKRPSEWSRYKVGKHLRVTGESRLTTITHLGAGTSYFIESNEKATLAYIAWTGLVMNPLLTKCVYAEREHGALCAIEQLLSIALVRQYKVGKYRIDGYCVDTNTAYEIDEAQHFDDKGLKQTCKERQLYIERALGCTTVRIKV